MISPVYGLFFLVSGIIAGTMQRRRPCCDRVRHGATWFRTVSEQMTELSGGPALLDVTQATRKLQAVAVGGRSLEAAMSISNFQFEMCTTISVPVL